MKAILTITDPGINEDWGVLNKDGKQIRVRLVTSGMNTGLICARDCTEGTNAQIDKMLLSGYIKK